MDKKEIKEFVDKLPSDVRFGMLLILDAQYGNKYAPPKKTIQFKRKQSVAATDRIFNNNQKVKKCQKHQ